jgi:alkyl hydroperoxide reductase subunit AhpC
VPSLLTNLEMTEISAIPVSRPLRLNDTVPNFTQVTTQGEINFHEWMGDSWVCFFSHPKAFTPICTTELGFMAGLEGEFARRNTKVCRNSSFALS